MNVEQAVLKQSVFSCGLSVTDNARRGISKYAKDEFAFFAMQQAFDVHIEKGPINKHGNMAFSVFFDNEMNEALAAHLNGRVAVMECVSKNDGFLATGFHVRGRSEPVRTNRRFSTRLKFQIGRPMPLPIELYTSLRELPVAAERSEYVQKRISSWEGYLRIQERNADAEDVITSFTKARLNEDFSKLRVSCHGLKANEWKTITGFSAKFKGQSHDFGQVVQANRSQSIVEIELNRKYQAMARRQEWPSANQQELVFSNFAELSQVKRLRKGFKDLQDGLAANPNLEKILFEERPVVRISKKQLDLEFHNNLNEFQREAVTGAMTANDLYVIQGPPGTGKTTVISEICHQNVKAGLRTLVASQANLAVDNALGRLLTHQDIRILRYGRTESIEEEGKRFIEENVASHWRDQTLRAVQEHLLSHAERKNQLERELDQGVQRKEKYVQDLESIAERIRLKEAAHTEQQTIVKEWNRLNAKTEELHKELENLVQAKAELSRSAEQLDEEIEQIEAFLHVNSDKLEQNSEIERLKGQMAHLRNEIAYRETLQQIDMLSTSLETLRREMETKQRNAIQLRAFSENLPALTKLDSLKNQLAEIGIMPNDETLRNMKELNRLVATIQEEKSSYTEWLELSDRLDKALEMIEKILVREGFWKQIQQYPVPANRRYTALRDINALIDNIGRYIVRPDHKQALAVRTYSPKKFEILENVATAFNILKDRKWYTETQLAAVNESKSLFHRVKEGIAEQVKLAIYQTEQELTSLQANAEAEESKLLDMRTASSAQLAVIGEFDETAYLAEKIEQLADMEKMVASYEETIAIWNEKSMELEAKKKQQQDVANRIETNTEAHLARTAEIEKYRLQMNDLEARQQELAALLEQQPEAEQQQVQTKMKELSARMAEWEREQERLPITMALQEKWVSLLQEANDYDLDEIRKLYVRHANVIGTTCVASARRDFMEEYPDFDVVIIDEVSKATPPELLLPILKGKKIILVGDHHQLPPLVGQETMDEFLEEIEDREEKRELEKLLKESLFERLFRTLPKQNKTMLGIQYRMHESIMETIAPFYEEGDSRLLCGLDDSDTVRDHLLESRHIKRKDHLLWFDLPNAPAFYEEKAKGGTSLYNQAELNVIRDLLEDLDESVGTAKQQGRFHPDDRKSVGVISFYGEQVKRIDRLIQQELIPRHLHCRTGSVDKFQGMEMDVIVLSFVRNHREKSGSIGFAKDYRRLNVALSRARELLIVVGSSEMFTIRTKDAKSREMYGRLLDEIKKGNGLREVQGQLG